MVIYLSWSIFVTLSKTRNYLANNKVREGEPDVNSPWRIPTDDVTLLINGKANSINEETMPMIEKRKIKWNKKLINDLLNKLIDNIG